MNILKASLQTFLCFWYNIKFFNRELYFSLLYLRTYQNTTVTRHEEKLESTLLIISFYNYLIWKPHSFVLSGTSPLWRIKSCSPEMVGADEIKWPRPEWSSLALQFGGSINQSTFQFRLISIRCWNPITNPRISLNISYKRRHNKDNR